MPDPFDEALEEACSPVGWLRLPGVAAFVICLAFAPVVPLIQVGAGRGWWLVWLVGAVVAVVAFVAIRWRAGRAAERAAVAERAWLHALPFRVVDFPELFPHEPRSRKRWRLELAFEQQSPSAEAVRARFAGFAERVDVSRTASRVHVDLSLPRGLDNSPSRLYRYRVLFHRAIDECLRPLHAEHALTSVEPSVHRT